MVYLLVEFRSAELVLNYCSLQFKINNDKYVTALQ